MIMTSVQNIHIHVHIAVSKFNRNRIQVKHLITLCAVMVQLSNQAWQRFP